MSCCVALCLFCFIVCLAVLDVFGLFYKLFFVLAGDILTLLAFACSAALLF